MVETGNLGLASRCISEPSNQALGYESDTD